MGKYDGALVGRAAGLGALAGAVTGVVTLVGFLLIAAVDRGAGGTDWAAFAGGILQASLMIGAFGAIVGVAAGGLAGIVLMLVGARRLEGSWGGRLVCAAVCGGVFGVPMLVAGFGWENWFRGPWAWVAVWVVAAAVGVGAWKAPYLLREKPPAEQGATAGQDGEPPAVGTL